MAAIPSFDTGIGKFSLSEAVKLASLQAQGKMKNKTIKDEELRAAIKKFLMKGGVIDKLPDQKSNQGKMVGKKWDSSELGGDLFN